MKQKVLIFGISGQDGSYLSEHLLEQGHEVYGVVRRHSISESQHQRLDHIQDNINFYYGDLTDVSSIEKIMAEVKPDLIFNLAAQSHVRISFEIPQYTIQVNGLGVVNLLEAYRKLCPNAKFYQASSSEMFGLGIEDDLSQNENTPMIPTSPYGCAKLMAYNLVRHYRRAYGLHACNGILFNHSSPRRGLNFVTQKVIKGAVEIKLGLRKELELGNMGSFRDWGHSKDYTRAMIMIINHTIPDDFVISTGGTHCIEEMCQVVFEYLGLDYKKYIRQNLLYLRPEELPYLKGDSTKARTILGWKPEYTFESMIKEMCDYWLNKLK